jgi:predicted house-cleaning noncanonical NTP pyrophosphatase (MazG superfamily)
MFNKNIADNIKDHIKTICNSSISVISILGDENYDRSLTETMEQAVAAMVRHYNLDESVLDEYRQTIEAANGEITEAAAETTYLDAEDARDMILDLCDKLTDPKEIMRFVRAAIEVANVWFSEQ